MTLHYLCNVPLGVVIPLGSLVWLVGFGLIKKIHPNGLNYRFIRGRRHLCMDVIIFYYSGLWHCLPGVYHISLRSVFLNTFLPLPCFVLHLGNLSP